MAEREAKKEATRITLEKNSKLNFTLDKRTLYRYTTLPTLGSVKVRCSVTRIFTNVKLTATLCTFSSVRFGMLSVEQKRD
ncbi:MAG: hypothetical protein ACI9IA_002088, partial [Enterobacterales bacterium]